MALLTQTPISEAAAAVNRRLKREPRYKMRWLLAHDPPVVFEEAAIRLVNAVSEKTNGEVQVEPMTTNAYFAGHGGEFIVARETIQCLMSGEVQMAHTYLASLGGIHNRLWALEMPFLFRDHEHAMRVLDGPIGQGMMRALLAVGLKGIAFAYSGGYRILPSAKHEIRRLEDFQGLRIRTSGNPVTMAYLESIGAVPVKTSLENIIPFTRKGKIDAAETTYVRYMAQKLQGDCPIINHTQHSLFMTILVVNQGYFQRLPAEIQEIVADCARTACLEERVSSIDLENELQVSLPKEEGVRIVPLEPEEKKRMIEAAEPLYRRFDPYFGEGFLKSIRESP